MSDQKLRDLERRWRETGAAADEAAYLTERVRIGHLSRYQLALAAYCDHPAATLAYQHGSPAGLSREAINRALIAMAVDEVKPLLQSHPGLRRPWQAIIAAARALRCDCQRPPNYPCNRHALSNRPGSARRQDDLLMEEMGALNPQLGFEPEPGYARVILRYLMAMRAVRAAHTSTTPELQQLLIAAFNQFVTEESQLSGRLLINAALIPWALGQSDPLDELLADTAWMKRKRRRRAQS